MKKLLLLSLLILSFRILLAQQYHPLLDSINRWSYTGNYLPVALTPSACTYPNYWSDGMHYFTSGDTVVNGFNYKIILQNHQDFQDDCTFGFIREDTAARKIYFQDVLDSPEVLLYDFSMQIGDGIPISFLFEYVGSYFQSGIYFLDSIKMVNVKAGFRRTFYLNCHICPSSNTLIWIESVGNAGDEVYPYSANGWGGGYFDMCSGFPVHSFFQILTCFEHNQKVYFDSCTHQVATSNFCLYYEDSCDYWNICSGVQELTSILSFDLSPNPASNELKVSAEFKKATQPEILLWDILGQLQFEQSPSSFYVGKNEFDIKLPNMPNGLYFVELRLPEESLRKKLVIKQ